MNILRKKRVLGLATVLVCITCIGIGSVSCGEFDLTKIEIKAVKEVSLDKELFWPKWSPDQRHCSFRKGLKTLVCFSAESFKRLFEIPYSQNSIDEDHYTLNQWSPNGKYVYGVEENKDEEMALTIYNASGEKLLQTPYLQSIDTSSIRWSPDSMRVAFNENLQFFHEPDIWLADIATKETKDLTPDEFGKDYDFMINGMEPCDFGPEWAPSGKKLIYVSGKKAIMIFNFEDNKETVLVPIKEVLPLLVNKLRWSPGGKYILFNDLKDNKICIISAKGKYLKEFSYSEKLSRDPCDIVWLGENLILLDFNLVKPPSHYPTSKWLVLFGPQKGHIKSWQTTAGVGISPDRRYLSYVQKDENEICNLYIMDVKSQKTKKLAQGKAGYGEPSRENKLSFTERSRVFWTSKPDTIVVRSGLYWYCVTLKGTSK